MLRSVQLMKWLSHRILWYSSYLQLIPNNLYNTLLLPRLHAEYRSHLSRPLRSHPYLHPAFHPRTLYPSIQDFTGHRPSGLVHICVFYIMQDSNYPSNLCYIYQTFRPVRMPVIFIPWK